MAGLYFLFSLCVVVAIVRWYVRNDKVAMGGSTTGMLRMKDLDSPAESKEGPGLDSTPTSRSRARYPLETS